MTGKNTLHKLIGACPSRQPPLGSISECGCTARTSQEVEQVEGLAGVRQFVGESADTEVGAVVDAFESHYHGTS